MLHRITNFTILQLKENFFNNWSFYLTFLTSWQTAITCLEQLLQDFLWISCQIYILNNDNFEKWCVPDEQN